MAGNAPVFSQSFLPLPEHVQPSTPAGAFHDTIAATYHQQQHQQQQHQQQQQQQQHDLLSTLSFNLAVNHAQQTSVSSTGSTSPPPVHLSPHAPGAVNAAAGWDLASAHPSPAAAPANSNSHDLTASLYQCADCLRRYARPEHLQRHIATHTLGKRFACDVCGKAFGRADLLKRHRANHEEDPTGMKKRRLASAPGAARVAQACAGCARARVKCEEVKPCARCRTRGIPCKYSSSAGVSPYHSIHRRTTSPDGSGRGTSRQARPNKSPSPGFTQEQPQKSQLYQMPTSATSPPIGSVDVVPGSYPDFSGGSAAFGFSTAQPSLVMQSEGTLAAVTPRNFTPDVNVPFSDFMRGILYQHGTDTPSDTTSLHGLAVLDFCNTSNLELDDIDFSFLGNWGIARDGASLQQAPQLHQHQQEQQVETQHQQYQHEYQQQCDEDSCTSDGDSPGISSLRHRLVKLWDDDRLRWAPNPQNTGYDDQENLPVPSATAAMAEAASFAYDALGAVSSRSVPRRRLDGPSRDRILAIVLATRRKNTTMPSSYIHIPSFSVGDSPPDLLACCAAAGATMTSNLTLRKFGFAVQEAVGIVIPKNFEDNNQRASDRALVQAVVLGQDIGLWSGNKRKIEIAECHTDIPITMMRYRNRFKMASYPVIHVAASDSGAELEAKWTQRRDQESLVFHCFMRDAQISFTSLRGSHMSYAELTLPLPAPSQVWAARDASKWQAQYLATMAAGGGDHGSTNERDPCPGDLIRDPELLARNYHRIDIRLAISIYLHGFWSMIWELRQMAAAYGHSIFSSPAAGGGPDGGSKPGASSSAVLLLNSRHQGLCSTLDSFAVDTMGWSELTEAESLTLQLLQLHLHVSLDDLQSRRALWHAGQILRLARAFPRGRLKDSSAIAVHHAALALWTYGVVTRAAAVASAAPTPSPRTQRSSTSDRDRDCGGGGGGGDGLVFLDGPHSPQVADFVAFGQGRAAIHASRDLLAQEVLRANFTGEDGSGDGSVLPTIENLCCLLARLGSAADEIRKR
ncbi:C2H2 type zinc finger domain-containing protein [Gaeumannomyces tritici R3-111a-1]|uniref:C2H2 type zinc finger domain-containing protein n=1 Tax=Gaeumannomyces tritici (strain R3-111a-1) TaxID=644352 RepID=J3PFE7_GAET3|nr:C2H2 type zinc finger domain-containing protein [Gaeumannomyces tritici R3-111a-1]EJT70049.1 C2H2 type zinc finger domain-containing protein [Gaeumannomyces tritici R3-111a-1]